jgi:NitT/TauT family transport system substrate-binding protein
LSNKDGQFLFSRDANKGGAFRWSQLRGKPVMGWHRSNSPDYMFEAALLDNNIDPEKDIKLNADQVSSRLYH